MINRKGRYPDPSEGKGSGPKPAAWVGIAGSPGPALPTTPGRFKSDYLHQAFPAPTATRPLSRAKLRDGPGTHNIGDHGQFVHFGLIPSMNVLEGILFRRADQRPAASRRQPRTWLIVDV